MQIDIYSKYKVRFLNSGARISQEDSTFDDIAFTHYENDKEEIRDRNAQLSGNGLRVLGFAMKYIDDKHNPNENKENHNSGQGSDHRLLLRH